MLLSRCRPCPRRATNQHRCRVLFRAAPRSPTAALEPPYEHGRWGLALRGRAVNTCPIFLNPFFSFRLTICKWRSCRATAFAGDAPCERAAALWHWWPVVVPDPSVGLGRPRRRPALLHRLSQLPLHTASLSLFTKGFGTACDEGMQAIITGVRAESRGLVCFFGSRAVCSAASVSLLIIKTSITMLYLCVRVLVYLSLKPPALVALGGGFFFGSSAGRLVVLSAPVKG